MTSTFTANTVASWIEAEIVGDGETEIRDVAPLDKATASDLAFAGEKTSPAALLAAEAAVVIVPRSLADQVDDPGGLVLLVVAADPQAAILDCLARIRPRRERPRIGVSPHAYVSDTATVGDGTNVHPNAHVMDDVVIGENCDILPGAYIGPGCRIGNDVVVHPYAVLYENVDVGDRATIHATAVVGADGFGYRLEQGRHVRIPHYGGVRIENDAEVGASTTVDRGMIADTVVGEGTKLDNLVMVAHNCELGKHNVIVGQVGFAGSVTTGDYVVCAGHVGVADHVHLGTGCVLGSKAGVNKDVPGGETWIGQPAQPVQEAMRAVMASKKVPEMRKQIRALEKRLEVLESTNEADSQAA